MKRQLWQTNILRKRLLGLKQMAEFSLRSVSYNNGKDIVYPHFEVCISLQSWSWSRGLSSSISWPSPGTGSSRLLSSTLYYWVKPGQSGGSFGWSPVVCCLQTSLFHRSQQGQWSGLGWLHHVQAGSQPHWFGTHWKATFQKTHSRTLALKQHFHSTPGWLCPCIGGTADASAYPWWCSRRWQTPQQPCRPDPRRSWSPLMPSLVLLKEASFQVLPAPEGASAVGQEGQKEPMLTPNFILSWQVFYWWQNNYIL